MRLLKKHQILYPWKKLKIKLNIKKKRYKRFNSFEFTKIQRSKMIKFKA